MTAKRYTLQGKTKEGKPFITVLPAATEHDAVEEYYRLRPTDMIDRVVEGTHAP